MTVVNGAAFMTIVLKMAEQTQKIAFMARGAKRMKTKSKIKQFFCRHRYVEYAEPVTKYHALNTQTVCTFCRDCGKLLKTEHISNEEYLFRFH